MEQALTEGRISRTLWKDFREKSKEEKIKSPYETGKMNLIKPLFSSAFFPSPSGLRKSTQVLQQARAFYAQEEWSTYFPNNLQRSKLRLKRRSARLHT